MGYGGFGGRLAFLGMVNSLFPILRLPQVQWHLFPHKFPLISNIFHLFPLIPLITCFYCSKLYYHHRYRTDTNGGFAFLYWWLENYQALLWCPLRFGLVLKGECINQKKLDVKTWPLSGPNRTHQSCYPTWSCCGRTRLHLQTKDSHIS